MVVKVFPIPMRSARMPPVVDIGPDPVRELQAGHLSSGSNVLETKGKGRLPGIHDQADMIACSLTILRVLSSTNEIHALSLMSSPAVSIPLLD